MKKIRKILSLLLVAVMLAAVLCSCGDGKTGSSASDGKGNSANTEPSDGIKEITVGIAQDLDDSLDPHSTTAAGTREVFFNVFEGLVKPDTNGDLIPAVASSYVISENADTFTFTLREGVRFHDGSEVTVGDIVYSISRIAGLETGQPLVAAFSAVESVEATDEKTVVIRTNEPFVEFLSFLTAAIIPEGSDPADGLIGTGPFKFVSRSAQENIILEKFDDYWGEGAMVDRVVFKVIENSDTLVMSLRSGAVDISAHLTSTQCSALGDGFQILEDGMDLVQALYLNNDYEPLSDIRVRQALNYAVDRQMILDFVSDGKGSILGSSMYPSFAKYYEDLSAYYTQDIEKAKALMAEAGYENGFDLVIKAPSNYPIHVDTAQIIAEQLKAINVNVKVDIIEWSTWLSDVYSARDFQATVVGFDTSAALTAQSMLARFVSTSSKNLINFNSSEYDETFAAALAATDEATQISLYKKCQTILAAEAANVYIQEPCDFVAVRNGISGYQFYPLYVMDLSKISID